MSDSSPPAAAVEGGLNITASNSNFQIGGDLVGRDKIINNIQNIQNVVERALSAAEETEKDRSIEAKYLAEGVTAFIKDLQRVLSQPDAGGNPYKGLLEYRLGDTEYFFGRATAIREVLSCLQTGPLTVLHAESGAGKTSLIQAGLVARLLGAGHIPVYLRPYNQDPVLVVKRAFLPDPGQAPLLATAPLRDFLARVCQLIGEKAQLIICLDQFEEFFRHRVPEDRADFVSQLAECLDDNGLRVRWVLGMRSEFFGNLATFRPRIRNPFENEYRLSRLTRDEAQEVATQPAAMRGVSYETGLVETLLTDLGENEIEPAQLQLVCSVLYEDLGDAKTITRAQYEKSGGALGILRDHLGKVLDRDVPPDQRLVARRLLEALITADGQRVIRTRADLLTELQRAFKVSPETLDAILEQLVDSRLLRAQETIAKEGETFEVSPGLSYELAHDYLLNEIKLDPTVQARKAAQELLDQETRTYERHGTLLGADELAILAPREGELAMNAKAKELLQKSEAQLRRQRGFVLGGIGLVIVLVLLGIASAVSAVAARGEANKAQHLQGTAQAGAQVAATREAAANAVAQTQFERTGIIPVGREPYGLAFDGQRVWVANSADDTVQAINLATGQAGPAISVGHGPYALVFDGENIWVANNRDDTVQSFNPNTGVVSPPISVGDGPIELAFDGQQLWVTNNSAGTVQAIDIQTRQIVATVEVNNEPQDILFAWGLVWVTNYQDDTVQAIDPMTYKVTATIETDAAPGALAFDGRLIWVANFIANSVQSIDPTLNQASEPIRVGVDPADLVWDGHLLWISASGDDIVQALDPATRHISVLVRSGALPSGLVFDGTRLWVSNQNDNTVQPISPAASRISPPIQVASGPVALVYDGAQVWVSNYLNDTVQAINPETSIAGTPIAVGHRPYALTFDGDHLWVANYSDNTLQSINPRTGLVSRPLAVGLRPIALTFDGNFVWVADYDANTVEAIDPVSGGTGALIEVGENPDGLYFDGRRLWVTCYGDNTVVVINPLTQQVEKVIPVGNHPRGLGYDGKKIWVTNINDNSIQAIDPTTYATTPALPFGSHPLLFAFDGLRLWSPNYTNNTLQAFNVQTLTAEEQIRIGKSPDAVVFDGSRIWVANYGDDTVRFVEIYR